MMHFAQLKDDSKYDVALNDMMPRPRDTPTDDDANAPPISDDTDDSSAVITNNDVTMNAVANNNDKVTADDAYDVTQHDANDGYHAGSKDEDNVKHSSCDNYDNDNNNDLLYTRDNVDEKNDYVDNNEKFVSKNIDNDGAEKAYWLLSFLLF